MQKFRLNLGSLITGTAVLILAGVGQGCIGYRPESNLDGISPSLETGKLSKVPTGLQDMTVEKDAKGNTVFFAMKKDQYVIDYSTIPTDLLDSNIHYPDSKMISLYQPSLDFSQSPHSLTGSWVEFDGKLEHVGGYFKRNPVSFGPEWDKGFNDFHNQWEKQANQMGFDKDTVLRHAYQFTNDGVYVFAICHWPKTKVTIVTNQIFVSGKQVGNQMTLSGPIGVGGFGSPENSATTYSCSSSQDAAMRFIFEFIDSSNTRIWVGPGLESNDRPGKLDPMVEMGVFQRK